MKKLPSKYKITSEVLLTILLLISTIFLSLFLVYIHGSSVVTKNNRKIYAMIRSKPNFRRMREKINFLLEKRPKNNVFIFTKNTMYLVRTRIHDKKDIKRLKSDLMEASELNIVKITSGRRLIRCCNLIDQSIMENDCSCIYEESWLGRFYVLTGGVSLSSTILGVNKMLKPLEYKEKTGVAFLGNNFFMFSYQNESVDVVIKFSGVQSEFSPVDVFCFFLKIGPIIENLNKEITREQEISDPVIPQNNTLISNFSTQTDFTKNINFATQTDFKENMKFIPEGQKEAGKNNEDVKKEKCRDEELKKRAPENIFLKYIETKNTVIEIGISVCNNIKDWGYESMEIRKEKIFQVSHLCLNLTNRIFNSIHTPRFLVT